MPVVLALALLVAGAGLIFKVLFEASETPSQTPSSVSMPKNCEFTTEPIDTSTFRDRRWFSSISKYYLLKGYYQCRAARRGELVLYQFSQKSPPVAKKIVAVAGDSIGFYEIPDRQAWGLKINDDIVLDAQSAPYFFGKANIPSPLHLFAKKNPILGEGQLVLLSSVAPGLNDSGIFGVVSREDLVGKITDKLNDKMTE